MASCAVFRQPVISPSAAVALDIVGQIVSRMETFPSGGWISYLVSTRFFRPCGPKEIIFSVPILHTDY